MLVGWGRCQLSLRFADLAEKIIHFKESFPLAHDIVEKQSLLVHFSASILGLFSHETVTIWLQAVENSLQPHSQSQHASQDHPNLTGHSSMTGRASIYLKCIHAQGRLPFIEDVTPVPMRAFYIRPDATRFRGRNQRTSCGCRELGGF